MTIELNTSRAIKYRITYDAQGHTKIYRAVCGSFDTKKKAEKAMAAVNRPNSKVEKFL